MDMEPKSDPRTVPAQHSTNEMPFILVGKAFKILKFSCSPTTAKDSTSPCPQVPQPHEF